MAQVKFYKTGLDSETNVITNSASIEDGGIVFAKDSTTKEGRLYISNDDSGVVFDNVGESVSKIVVSGVWDKTDPSNPTRTSYPSIRFKGDTFKIGNNTNVSGEVNSLAEVKVSDTYFPYSQGQTYGNGQVSNGVVVGTDAGISPLYLFTDGASSDPSVQGNTYAKITTVNDLGIHCGGTITLGASRSTDTTASTASFLKVVRSRTAATDPSSSTVLELDKDGLLSVPGGYTTTSTVQGMKILGSLASAPSGDADPAIIQATIAGVDQFSVGKNGVYVKNDINAYGAMVARGNFYARTGTNNTVTIESGTGNITSSGNITATTSGAGVLKVNQIGDSSSQPTINSGFINVYSGNIDLYSHTSSSGGTLYVRQVGSSSYNTENVPQIYARSVDIRSISDNGTTIAGTGVLKAPSVQIGIGASKATKNDDSGTNNSTNGISVWHNASRTNRGVDISGGAADALPQILVYDNGNDAKVQISTMGNHPSSGTITSYGRIVLKDQNNNSTVTISGDGGKIYANQIGESESGGNRPLIFASNLLTYNIGNPTLGASNTSIYASHIQTYGAVTVGRSTDQVKKTLTVHGLIKCGVSVERQGTESEEVTPGIFIVSIDFANTSDPASYICVPLIVRGDQNNYYSPISVINNKTIGAYYDYTDRKIRKYGSDGSMISIVKLMEFLTA